LLDLLERRFGVDEEDFAAALAAFADRAGPLSVADVRPRQQFGPTARAALRRMGATLEPLASEDLGPVAGLAAAFADLSAKSLSVAEAARRLGVDTSRVRQRIYARSLYAFKQRGSWLLPPFQFRKKSLLPGLDAVVPAIRPALHPVAVSRWFTSPNPDLDLEGEAVSPVDWLAAGGDPAAAADLAGAIDQR
jgi:hypothetical protein